MQVLLSFDYELFFGSDTGTVKRCMIEPTNALLDISEQYHIPMTFFIDIGFLMRLEEQKDEFDGLQQDFEEIVSQIQRMEALGCDVQLHIHPHWERSFYDGKKWVVITNECYKLSDFSDDEAETIVRKYYTALQQFVSNPISVYRAGGWCIQPFSQVEKVFQELGITTDSSVFPGGNFSSEHYAFDFTAVPPFTDVYHFQSDVCVEEKNGFFTEIPIASWKYSPLFYWELYLLGRLFPSRHKMMGDGSFLAQPGRKKSVLTSFTWNHVSCDGYYAKKLRKQLTSYQQKGCTTFVVIGHPKGLTRFSVRKLNRFVGKMKDTHTFMTYSSVACNS
jgi:hypothetical protein